MSILIDGHNLIGQIADLALSDPDDEARLVQRLKVYRNVANRPITVVFDPGPSYTPPHNLSGGGVEVVFANRKSSADELIMARIWRYPDPGHLLVVSSDREIMEVARSRGAEVVTAQDFARMMAKFHGPKRQRSKRLPQEAGLSQREVQEWLDLFRSRSKKSRVKR